MARKKNPHKPLDDSEFSDDLIELVQEHISCKRKVITQLLNSAIKSKETTNDKDEMLEWAWKYLLPNVIRVVETPEEFIEIYKSARTTFSQQKSIGIGGKVRGPMESMEDKFKGYLVEFAFQKMMRKFGLSICVDHSIGKNPEDFYGSDFPRILRDGVWDKTNIDVGAKSGSHRSAWFDIPVPQFSRTHLQVYGKHIMDDSQLGDFALRCLDALFMGENLCIADLSFKPIYVHMIGWAERCALNEKFSFVGSMGKTIFTVNEAKGVLPPDYRSRITKDAGLYGNPEVKFNVITNFSKAKNSKLYIQNLGQMKKTIHEFQELAKRL